MKTTFFSIFVSLFGFLPDASAQNQKTVDSLTAVLSTKVAGDRYAPLYELTFEYLDRNNEMALHFIEEAEKAALLSGDSLWIVKSTRVHGQILYRLEQIREAILSFETGLRIASQNEFEGESKLILSALGLCHLFRGEFDKALLKFDTAAQLAKQEADTIMLIQNLNNTGITYFQLHDPEKALIYHLKVLEMEEQTNYSEVESWADINISLCYSWLHQYATAAAYLKKSLDKCRNGCSEKRRMHNEFASALIYQGMNEPNRALNEFFSSLALAKKRGGSRMIFDNLVRISDVLIMENRLNEAESYLKDAEELIFRKVPFPIEQINVYWKFCQVYEKLGDSGHLAFYQHKYIQLKDSILNNEITSRLMKAESEFKARESKARIASQGEVILLNEGIIHRQKLLNIVTALLGLVTLAFAVFIFLNYRKKQHLSKLLEEKVRERTMELEHSRDEMLRMLEEKDLRMRQASYAITTSVNSIEGLCLTGRREVSLPLIHSYLQRIGNASRAIVGNVDEYLRHGVLQEVS